MLNRILTLFVVLLGLTAACLVVSGVYVSLAHAQEQTGEAGVLPLSPEEQARADGIIEERKRDYTCSFDVATEEKYLIEQKFTFLMRQEGLVNWNGIMIGPQTEDGHFIVLVVEGTMDNKEMCIITSYSVKSEDLSMDLFLAKKKRQEG